MISLRLSNLSHEFDGRTVFSGLSLEFSGASLAVTGPNGSGKTTLLKLLAGLLTPSLGVAEVVVDQTAAPRELLRDLVGFAGPDVRLYPEMTPRENLRFLARSHGLREAEAVISSTLLRVELADRSDDPVGELSSGLCQRACLAAALLHEPRVLLLDEPSNCLDGSGVEMLHRVIAEQAAGGMVVLATNDPSEAGLARERVELG